jgi:chromosome segregation ATPase
VSLEEMEREIENLLRSSEDIRKAMVPKPTSSSFNPEALSMIEKELQNAVEIFQHEKAKMQETIEELTSQLETTRIELKAERQDKVKKIEEEKRKAERAKLELMQRISSLEGEKSKLSQEVGDLQSKKSSALSDKSGLLQEMASLKQQCALSATENAKLKAELFNTQQNCQKLQSALLELKQVRDTLVENSKSEGGNGALEAELRRKEAVIKSLQDDLSQLKASLGERDLVEADLRKVTASLKDKDRENERLVRQLSDLSKPPTPDSSFMNHTKSIDLTKIEEQMKETSQRIGRLERQLLSSHTDLSNLRPTPRSERSTSSKASLRTVSITSYKENKSRESTPVKRHTRGKTAASPQVQRVTVLQKKAGVAVRSASRKRSKK